MFNGFEVRHQASVEISCGTVFAEESGRCLVGRFSGGWIRHALKRAEEVTSLPKFTYRQIATSGCQASSTERARRPPGVLKKVPHPIDRNVGSRLRMQRLLVGVSQEKLSGVTFQQIQNYEKGSNRVSASRLQQIAKVLNVPVAFFFEGAPAGDTPTDAFPPTDASAAVSEFLATSGGVQLTKAFLGIKSGRVVDAPARQWVPETGFQGRRRRRRDLVP